MNKSTTVHMQDQIKNNVKDIMRHQRPYQTNEKNIDISLWLGLTGLTMTALFSQEFWLV
jgi:hypothetical protein